MPAKEVPAQKVLKGHFALADTPTILRRCFELPIDPTPLTLEYKAEYPARYRGYLNVSEKKSLLNEAFYNKLETGPGRSTASPRDFVIATPIQRNVSITSLGLLYAAVNLHMDLIAEDVVARAQAQGWETIWEDETDYCDVNTGVMGRRQVGHVKFIICDTDSQLRSLPQR